MIIDYSEIISIYPLSMIHPDNLNKEDSIYELEINDYNLCVLSNTIIIRKYDGYEITIYHRVKILRIVQAPYNPWARQLKLLLSFKDVESEHDLFQARIVNELYGINYEFINYINEVIERVHTEFII